MRYLLKVSPKPRSYWRRVHLCRQILRAFRRDRREQMPQDRNTGAAGREYGLWMGGRLAELLGAQRLGPGSNEVRWRDKTAVIKACRARTSTFGVTARMLDRLDCILAGFEDNRGQMGVWELAAEQFRDAMFDSRSTGSNGRVKMVTRAFALKHGRAIAQFSRADIERNEAVVVEPRETLDEMRPDPTADAALAVTRSTGQTAGITPGAPPPSLESIAPLIDQARQAALAYKRSTGRPLGVTGEIGEYEAVRLLGLELAPVREAGYDAVDAAGVRYQIKARCFAPGTRSGRLGGIKSSADWDVALMVLLDEALQPTAIWRADREAVITALSKPGSLSRNVRGALAVSQFKSIGRCVWASAG